MFRKNTVLLLLLLVPSTYFGQFEIGKHNFGPSLGFSFLGSAPQLGLNHEYGIDLKKVGLTENGKIGVGGIFRYWTYTENFTDVKTDYRNILIGIQNNYHFNLSNERLDPWIGLVLAYDFVTYNQSVKTENVNINEPSVGGLWIGAHAGLRFWLKENMAINTRIGFGTLSYGALELGFDYKFD